MRSLSLLALLTTLLVACSSSPTVTPTPPSEPKPVVTPPAPPLPRAGDLDLTFGTQGILELTLPITGGYTVNDAITQADGKLVFAGQVWRPADAYDLLLFRLTPDGQLDPSFGTGGAVTLNLGLGSNDRAVNVRQQRSGQLVVQVGQVGRTLKRDSAVIRFNTDGSRDLGFGAGGLMHNTYPGDGLYQFPDTNLDVDCGTLVVRPDDSLVAGCTLDGQVLDNTINTRRYDVALEFYTAKGQLDTASGVQGRVRLDFGKNALSEDLAVDPQGRVVMLATQEISVNPRVNTLALTRFTAGGQVDASFGPSGTRTYTLSKTYHNRPKLLINKGGETYTLLSNGGESDVDNTYDLMYVGVMDAAQGKLVGNVTAFKYQFRALEMAAVQPDGKTLVSSFRGVVRLNADGSRDITFAEDGILSEAGDQPFTSLGVLRASPGRFVAFNLASISNAFKIAAHRY